MKWTPVTKYCIQSECRRYLIAKYRIRDEWLYQLSRGGESLHIGSLAECKAAAR